MAPIPSIPSDVVVAAPPSSRRPQYIPNRIDDPNYVRVFDTTLRDGEQAPGACMTSAQKLAIARQLSRLGVDIMEAGFPASSPEDLNAVRAIAMEVGNIPMGEDGHVPVISAFARSNRRDVDAAWEAVRHARRPRLHTFIATSEIHMRHKLRKTREEVVSIARDMVAYARSLCDDVEFGAEDAGRSDREFLYHILGEVIKAGATTINIPDTVGYTLPSEYGKLIADIRANTPGIENIILSTHCHNDLGLATANTLAGAYAGARQLELTINGIGERAGNASMDEVVMAIKCRQELLGGLRTGINTQYIVKTSKLVQELSGLHLQPNKAIVGANAFVHESGIHQDGMLKNKATYEIISPEDIGLTRSNEFGIVLGKLSGRHAVKAKLLELGYEINEKELDDLFKRYKNLAAKKKRITDEDIEALISGQIIQPKLIWSLGDLQVSCGTPGMSTVTVNLIASDGAEKVACSVGTGPVDAAYKAITSIIQIPTVLREYSMTSVTEGFNAMAKIRVVISGDNSKAAKNALNGHTFDRNFSGSGEAMDIVLSSVQAYLSALNKMLSFITSSMEGTKAAPELKTFQ